MLFAHMEQATRLAIRPPELESTEPLQPIRQDERPYPIAIGAPAYPDRRLTPFSIASPAHKADAAGDETDGILCAQK